MFFFSSSFVVVVFDRKVRRETWRERETIESDGMRNRVGKATKSKGEVSEQIFDIFFFFFVVVFNEGERQRD